MHQGSGAADADGASAAAAGGGGHFLLVAFRRQKIIETLTFIKTLSIISWW